MSSNVSAPNADERASGTEPIRIVSVVPLLPTWRLDRAFDYLVPDDRDDVATGALVRVPFGARNVRAVVVGTSVATPERELAPIGKQLLDEPVAPPPMDDLARWVATRYGVPLGKALDRFVPPRIRIARREPVPIEGGPEPHVVPTYDGGEGLLAAIEGGASGGWCLNALPSHDRAGLIAELVAAAGRAGGSALVAVPEVRFGPEIIERLEETWPGLATLHSAQDDAERARSWLVMARGNGLGAGGRSTLFAPAPELRLIVVDEEHHRTFKEDRSPRYDARRMALERARLQGAVCVLVSEAPTIESAGAAARGELGWVEPTRAARKAARPIIELIDPPERGELSEPLYARIRDALRAETDIALLAPRRGYARVVWCAACKRSLRCPLCETALVFERAGAVRVRCTRCDFRAAPPPRCPSCGADDFRYLGAGTERLAEQLAKAFPRAKVRRMDPEALSSGGPALGPTDIYVTSWIGTKRAIRPEARLVAVLDADGLIRRPDFRAAELGFQVLSEMARWAGPSSEGGRLVIQTSEPGHHALQAVVRGDPRFFLEREMEIRRDLGYPPYADLVKLSGPTDQVARAADEARRQGARVLGPIPLEGEDDATEFLAKTADAHTLMAGLRPFLASAEAGKLRIDSDPR